MRTAFRFISISLELTSNGIVNYKKVLALVLEYFRVVREIWLDKDEPIDLFNECKTIADLTWKMYSAPDPEE